MEKTIKRADELTRRLEEVTNERDYLIGEIEQVKVLRDFYEAGEEAGTRLNALIEGMVAGGLSREEAMTVITTTATLFM